MYKITKGQLIILWIIGVALFVSGWSSAINDYTYHNADTSELTHIWLFCLTVLIPLILIFYTLGWRNNKKKDKGN